MHLYERQYFTYTLRDEIDLRCFVLSLPRQNTFLVGPLVGPDKVPHKGSPTSTSWQEQSTIHPAHVKPHLTTGETDLAQIAIKIYFRIQPFLFT